MKSERKILAGLEKLVTLDGHLLEIDVSERAITHRLGMYYQDLFSVWDVDCEYNRHFNLPKDVEFDIRDLLNRMASLLRERGSVITQDLIGNLVSINDNISEELKNLEEQLKNPNLEYDPEQDLYFFLLQLMNGETIRKQITPDIIVHKRNRRNNLVVIEAKKTSNHNIASKEYDVLKLHALITDRRYKYKHGYFIDLPVTSAFDSFSRFDIVTDSFDSRIKFVLPH